MSITNEFNKTVIHIPGITIWSTTQWATTLFDRLILFSWGVFKIIISDRDRKFVNDIWKHIFQSFNVNFIYFTAWHPQTDGMSKRANQTAEIFLRYYIATLENIRTWPKVLFCISAFLNNLTNYNSAHQVFNQIFYGFRIKESLNLFRFNDPENENTISEKVNVISVFPVLPIPMHDYRPNHINAKNLIVFAPFKIKIYYDNKHQFKFYKIGDLMNLKLYRGYQLPTIKHPKIGFQIAGHFKVIERIGKLIYRLNFPNNIRIHDVISLARISNLPLNFKTTHITGTGHFHRLLSSTTKKNRISKN